MGLFDRSKRPLPGPAPTVVLHVPGKRRRMLVGNEYHPQAYVGARAGTAVTVELVPEAGNPHDPNALAAYVNGLRAGYLARGPAAEYRPLVSWANQLGYRLLVSGKFERPSGQPLSVTVLMPDAAMLHGWLSQPPEVRALGIQSP